MRIVNWVFGIACSILAVLVLIGFLSDLGDGQLLAESTRIPPTPTFTSTPTPVTPTATVPTEAFTETPTATATIPPPTNTPIPLPPTNTPVPLLLLQPAPPATATQPPRPVLREIPYTLEPGQGIEIIQVRASEDFVGDFELVGEVRNARGEEIDFLFFELTLYDSGGGILDATSGVPSVTPLQPGQTTAFRIYTTVAYAAVGSYRIQTSE